MRATSRRRLKLIAALSALAIVIWLGSSLAVAWRLTRRSRAPFAEPVPAALSGRVETLKLRTRDGQDLGAWFVDAAAVDANAPVALLLHGNDSCRSALVSRAQLFARHRCSALLVTLRAHGDSTGETNDFGWSARADVVAAVDWIHANHPGAPIVLDAYSLGAAAALYAAPEIGPAVRGWILESPYSDLRTAVRNRLEMYLFAPFDSVAYSGLLAVAPLFLPPLDQLSPEHAAPSIPKDVPVLLIAGAADRRVKLDEVRAIQAQLGDRAEFVVFERAGHEHLMETDPVLFEASVSRLLERANATQH